MPWREGLQPVRMQRVAVVAPRACLRRALVAVAATGAVELDVAGDHPDDPGRHEVEDRLHRLRTATPPAPLLSPTTPDLDELEQHGRADLLTGEADLAVRAAGRVTREDAVALAGWTPSDRLPELAAALAPVGGAVVPLATPPGTDPPTLLRSRGTLHRSFEPLVTTYTTVPYANVDPTVVAGLAYVLMFGMMFADAGHGALLVVAGLFLRAGRPARLAGVRRVWPFVCGAGVSAMAFGLLFGEFFGPTGVLPALWLRPLEEPLTLLVAAIGVGALLIGVAYSLGTVNRWREGGWRLALVAPSGIAGAVLFVGLGGVALGLVTGWGWLVPLGVTVAVGGVGLLFVGLLAASGGGGAGAAQAGVELFDSVIRLGTNLISFARLAAFGLTHAALGSVVWQGTVGLWERGGAAVLGAVAVFVVGNVLAFTLEAVVAAVQALRLEYYELFSRVFVAEGRPFRPWHVPVDTTPIGSRT